MPSHIFFMSALNQFLRFSEAIKEYIALHISKIIRTWTCLTRKPEQIFRLRAIHELLLADPDGFVPTGFAGIVMFLQHMFYTTEFPVWTPAHRTYAEHMGRRLLS